MNNITSSVSDVTETAIDAAGDALGFASEVAADLAGAAMAAAAIPGAKAGAVKGGLKLLRRHPYVIMTGILAAIGFKYWKAKQDANSGAPDSFPKAPSSPEQNSADSVESITAPTTA